MVTPAQAELLVLLVGDIPAGLLAQAVQPLILQYSGLDAVYAGVLLPGISMEMLRIERDLLKIKLAWAEGQVTQRTADEQMDLSDLSKRLRERYTALTTQITELEAKVSNAFGASTGLMTVTTTSPSPLGVPSPSADDQRYSGSPYVRPYKPQTS